MTDRLDPMKLGYAGAVVSAACMLLLGILGNIGIYTSAAMMMGEWHMFFSLSPLGIAVGMIEAAVTSFIGLYAFAWVYNKV